MRESDDFILNYNVFPYGPKIIFESGQIYEFFTWEFPILVLASIQNGINRGDLKFESGVGGVYLGGQREGHCLVTKWNFTIASWMV